MSKRVKLPSKYILCYVFIVLFFVIVIPLVCVNLFSDLTDDTQKAKYNGKIPSTVKVYITEKKRFETLDFEEYIEGVVASEMPSSFDFEALKAQAVASRTYALGRINAGAELCDTVHCQVYRSDNIPSKVTRAVKATAGQVLLYDGQLAGQALYFASSAGDTENAEDVFSNACPYLVSVSSSEEPGATHKEEKVTMTVSSFSDTLKKNLPEMDFGTIKKSNIQILSLTQGGRVKEIRVGSKKVVLSGADIRSAFSLYSTRFDISFKGKNITITTSGSGHGVGMSQYGAHGLAKKGFDYQQILAHYYQGTVVSE